MKRGPVRPFPRYSIRECLPLAKEILKAYGGHSCSTVLLAKELKIGASSSMFRDLLSSSEKYGLTSGGWRDKEIVLLKNGRSIVSPVSSDETTRAIINSLFNVALYHRFYSDFNGSKLPQTEHYANILRRDYGVPGRYVDECINQIKENASFAGILETVAGSDYIVLVKKVTVGDRAPDKTPTCCSYEWEQNISSHDFKDATQEFKQRPMIYLAQTNFYKFKELKVMLEELKVDYTFVEEETGGAATDIIKIINMMQKCSSAIFIFTCEEQEVDRNIKRGRFFDRIVFELGIACILYGDKIVILKEYGAVVPDFAGQFKCVALDDEGVAARTADIIRALIEKELIKLVTL